MSKMVIQVGDSVVIKNGGAKARGLVIVAPNDAGVFRIKSASGREYPATLARVLEHVPAVPVAPVVAADPVQAKETKRGGVRSKSMLGLALAILADGQPRHVKDLTAGVLAAGFQTSGKTPQATLAAHLLVAERKGLVVKTAPATFGIVGKQVAA